MCEVRHFNEQQLGKLQDVVNDIKKTESNNKSSIKIVLDRAQSKILNYIIINHG